MRVLVCSGMGAAYWPYVVVGSFVGVIGLWLLIKGLWGDRARGRKRCPGCWYDMSGLDRLQCPECGRAARTERSLLRSRRRWLLVFPGLLLASLGGFGASAPWLARAQWIQNAPRPILIAAMYITDGSQSRLVDEFERRMYGAQPWASWTGPSRRRAPAAPPLLATDLTSLERWCIRRIALGMVSRPPAAASGGGNWMWSSYPQAGTPRTCSWLAWLGPDGLPAVDDLMTMARTPGDDARRLRAIEVLARLRVRSKEVAACMETIVSTQDAVPVRVAAIQTIGLLGDDQQQFSRVMRALLRDPESAVRSAALTVLARGLAWDATLVDDLIAQIQREPNGPLRHYMISLMLHVDGRCGQMREIYEVILRREPHGSARSGALYGLRICSRTAAELRGYAEEAMRDPDMTVRLAALQTVLELGPEGRPSLPAVRQLLTDPNKMVADFAGECVQKLESSQP